MNVLQARLNALKPRERVIIIAGGILVLVVAIYMLALAPFYRAVHMRMERVEQKQADLAWMASVAGDMSVLNSQHPGPIASTGESLVVLVDHAARDCGLSSALTGQTPNGPTSIRVRLEAAEFDKLVLCIGNLQQQHAVSIESATIDRTAKPGLVNATLVLNRAAG